MGTNIINLQNSPDPEGTASQSVTFASQGVKLAGMLYLPEKHDGKLPAAIVTGAWTTVKEQMAGTYARELAFRGIAALTFDFSGWGESEGVPRYVENPAVKTADIEAAAAFLVSLDMVDDGRIYGLGICASSGYMAAAVAENEGLQKVALVAPWLHNADMAEAIYGGPDSVASLIAASDADDASETVLLAASATDENSVMYQAPYYTEEDRGLIRAYDNKFSVASWKPWLAYDAQASADRLNKPMMMAGSPSMALPEGAEAYETRTKAPLQKLWLEDDATQFDFYDRKDVVEAASDAVADFFKG